MQISEWLKIIGGLATLVPIPHAQLAAQLAAIVAKLIEAEKARSGKTTEEILVAAGLQQEATALLIEQELLRLDGVPTTAPLPPTE